MRSFNTSNLFDFIYLIDLNITDTEVTTYILQLIKHD